MTGLNLIFCLSKPESGGSVPEMLSEFFLSDIVCDFCHLTTSICPLHFSNVNYRAAAGDIVR